MVLIDVDSAEGVHAGGALKGGIQDIMGDALIISGTGKGMGVSRERGEGGAGVVGQYDEDLVIIPKEAFWGAHGGMEGDVAEDVDVSFLPVQPVVIRRRRRRRKGLI